MKALIGLKKPEKRWLCKFNLHFKSIDSIFSFTLFNLSLSLSEKAGDRSKKWRSAWKGFKGNHSYRVAASDGSSSSPVL